MGNPKDAQEVVARAEHLGIIAPAVEATLGEARREAIIVQDQSFTRVPEVLDASLAKCCAVKCRTMKRSAQPSTSATRGATASRAFTAGFSQSSAGVSPVGHPVDS